MYAEAHKRPNHFGDHKGRCLLPSIEDEHTVQSCASLRITTIPIVPNCLITWNCVLRTKFPQRDSMTRELQENDMLLQPEASL